MTLNNTERRNSSYFAFFSPNSIVLQADYVTVVEDRPIMYVKYCLLVPVFHFWPKLTHPAARSLCDSWASCFHKAIRKFNHVQFLWGSAKGRICSVPVLYSTRELQIPRGSDVDTFMIPCYCYRYHTHSSVLHYCGAICSDATKIRTFEGSGVCNLCNNFFHT